jgi:mono/diheme cytochrome c family protein
MDWSGDHAGGFERRQDRTLSAFEGIHSGLKWVLLTVALLGAPINVAWSQSKQTGRGESLAIKHCALCHVVGTFNKFGGIGSTPSFQLLASMRDGRERFESFFARLPHLSFVFLPDQEPPTGLPVSVPKVRLSHEDVRAIAKFAMTLKDPPLGD